VSSVYRADSATNTVQAPTSEQGSGTEKYQTKCKGTNTGPRIGKNREMQTTPNAQREIGMQASTHNQDRGSQFSVCNSQADTQTVLRDVRQDLCQADTPCWATSEWGSLPLGTLFERLASIDLLTEEASVANMTNSAVCIFAKVLEDDLYRLSRQLQALLPPGEMEREVASHKYTAPLFVRAGITGFD
jgi:hypothetical protein